MSAISEPEASISTKDKTDPGACRHGNFINYYQFHPAKDRLRQLPRDVWHADSLSYSTDRKYVGLDIGCNAGDLTLALYDFLKEILKTEAISLLGVDLDPTLIERAEEGNRTDKNSQTNRDIQYNCVDIMSEDGSETLNKYLSKKGRDLFDVTYCFSITMWIHMNHGDVGLTKFLKTVCQTTKLIVIEPQPWKCYKNACRRLKRANIHDVPAIDKLEYKTDVESHIERILKNECGFEKLKITENNEWGRKLIIYKRIFSNK